MNRIETIKERLDKVTHLRGNKGFDAREEFESCAEADIDYLLSKLEIAEKVLERISFETFGRDEPFSGSAYNLSQEALQQIRT